MKQIYKITIIIIALLQGAFSMNAGEFLSAVPTAVSLLDAIKGDYYIKPQKGIASDFQPGEEIEYSFDGNMATMYHSQWLGATVFPITLDYLFDETVSQIDYAVYYPMQTGSNGHFIEVEVWYSAAGGAMTKYKDYNFGGVNTPSTVIFEPAIVNPDTIRFIVKSGTGDSQGSYAACAEMEFYRKNTDFDYTSVFTDATCSELKPGVTTEDISAISVEFYRKLASDIFHGFYDSEFRVQEYKAYQTPDYMRNINKTARYGRSDGVTGIYAGANSDLVLLVETASNAMPVLFVHNIETAADGSSYSLRKGMNKIKIAKGGLLYIRYYTANGTEPPVKINIVNGFVSGYYDKARHTPADWPRLLEKATYSLFQMKGDYVVMCFDTSVLRTVAKNNGSELLNMFDELVYEEMKFQGLVKYNKMFNTRMCFFVDPNPNAAWMYATDYFTGYQKTSQNDLLSISQLKNPNSTSGAASWGPAHEVAHVNQTRPGFRWLGMTEVSNNVLSQYITTRWGVQSRLYVGGTNSYYNRGVREIVNAPEINSYLQHSDVFLRLVPFWQLKLYMLDVLGKADFYKDLYEKIRVNANPAAKYGCTGDAMCMLEFVRLTCEVSGYDMTGFFTDWKFLYPADFNIDDYSTNRFTVTQQGIDAIKAEIAAMGLPQPPVPAGKNLYEINDSNWESYKMP